MTGTEWAAIITAATGLVAAILSYIKSYKATAKSAKLESDTAMRTNFQQLYDSQSIQINDLQEDMKHIKLDQIRERRLWAVERLKVHEEIKNLTISNAEKDVTISELRGELRGLTARMDRTKAKKQKE